MENKKKHVLVINGHPDPESYNYALAAAYKKGLTQSDSVLLEIDIASLAFNPNLMYGYRQRTELEADLLASVEKIRQADHLVWLFPLWWYGYPALMKGFIDRVFLPGITYQPIAGKSFPRPLLKGKTARLVITADTPRWYDRLFMGSPAINQLKKGTLEFCGVQPVRITYIAVMRDSRSSFREKWLTNMEALGRKML